MEKYKTYVREFQSNNEFGLFFIDNQLKKHLSLENENQTEIEHILDYVYSNKKRFKSIGYKTISQKAEKWTRGLQKVAIKDKEVLGEDIELLKKWDNGYSVVKLISKDSYQREGKLMSHCCGSYYERGIEVYSLRDEKNLPHATIEKDNQIKGKGNGEIIPKYIGYVVEFLEEVGMSVRDSEMENLGYINIEYIEDDDVVFTELYRGKYFYKKNLDKILNKNGNRYESISLWNKFKLLDLSSKFEVNFNFDIQRSIDTFLGKTNGSYLTSETNRPHSIAATNKFASTAVANKEYSIAVTNESYSTSVANESYSTAVASESNSTAVTNGHYSIAVVNRASSTAVASESHSTAVANKRFSIAVTNKSYSTAVANESYSIAVANDSSSTAVADVGATALINSSMNSKSKGKKGSALFFVERDREKCEEILSVASVLIDGEEFKEDVFYTLKDGLVQEYSDDLFD